MSPWSWSNLMVTHDEQRAPIWIFCHFLTSCGINSWLLLDYLIGLTIIWSTFEVICQLIHNISKATIKIFGTLEACHTFSYMHRCGGFNLSLCPTEQIRLFVTHVITYCSAVCYSCSILLVQQSVEVERLRWSVVYIVQSTLWKSFSPLSSISQMDNIVVGKYLKRAF